MKLYSKLTWSILAILLVAADQASKLGMLHWLPDYVTFNTGSAFSSPIPRGLVIGLSLAIILGIIWYSLFRSESSNLSRSEFWISILILSGAVGNLIDRVRMAKVIDFINLQVWPVFNFADVYLSTAAGLIVWFYLIKSSNNT